ncbi:MAG: hypothetical protein IPG66_05865 [Hydrogenophilales bacterium]|nr:hypothetical protein [Hydrogenophilales bacterium]
MISRFGRLLIWLGSLALVLLANLIAPISILRGGARGWAVVQSNDMALNAALGGSPREYISTRCARARAAGKWWGRLMCRLIDAADPGHCDRFLRH